MKNSMIDIEQVHLIKIEKLGKIRTKNIKVKQLCEKNISFPHIEKICSLHQKNFLENEDEDQNMEV